MSSPVLVTGATGQVGLHAVDGLLRRGSEVLAVVRDADRAARTEIAGLSRGGLAGAIESLAHAGREFTLLSCGPMSLAQELLQSTGTNGYPAFGRVVVTGTTSLEVKQDSADPAERNSIAEIRSALAAISQACLERRIPLATFHPTLIYGCGMDQNLSRVYRWIARFGFAPLAATANGLRQPVHVADVASALVEAATSASALELESPLCGGETLPYREMIGRLFDAAEKKRRLVRIPGWLVGPAASIGSLLSGQQPISSEMFRRQSRDLVFDDKAVRLARVHRPRGFSPTFADFELKADIGRIRNALQC